MLEALSFDFMRNALWAGLFASVACGIIGVLVVVNRLVFLAGGGAHAAYGGVGLAFFFGLPVLPTTLGFTVFSALAMGAATLRRAERADTMIGVMWAAGMALGIILIDLTPGYNTDLMSFLSAPSSPSPWPTSGACGHGRGHPGLVLYYYKQMAAMSFRPGSSPRCAARPWSFCTTCSWPDRRVRGHAHPGGGTILCHGPSDHPAVPGQRRAPFRFGP
jgi:zinc transport system permease protein